MKPGPLFPLGQTPCLFLLHLEDWDTFITILLPYNLFHYINLRWYFKLFSA
jgi:hypothetical protein